jgi:hypothetical protein
MYIYLDLHLYKNKCKYAYRCIYTNTYMYVCMYILEGKASGKMSAMGSDSSYKPGGNNGGINTAEVVIIFCYFYVFYLIFIQGGVG